MAEKKKKKGMLSFLKRGYKASTLTRRQRGERAAKKIQEAKNKRKRGY